ncbi:hypothetical protein TGAM01_v209824 [Trichoderma gamsii]|uniref:Uncharacterized protein n=1 Tax=Trichoderma gamsii TaxID=398673 RepID=A0A2P4ZAN7_9HYPO|nr:hypothetical protein TGAM01_v209824 [Trichoderma gamsii]PON21373.1 hypothetical protein TGAM01_v209824 [Trichoderma gamsii]
MDECRPRLRIESPPSIFERRQGRRQWLLLSE